MPLDRTGEEAIAHECHKGWLDDDDEGRRVPCLICKPHLARPVDINDYDPDRISAAARHAIQKREALDAIERAQREDRQ